MAIKINLEDCNMRKLHHACANNDLYTLDYLLDVVKINPDARDEKTETHRQTGTQR